MAEIILNETTCNVCHKDYKTKSNLKRHQKCKYKCKPKMDSNANQKNDSSKEEEEMINLVKKIMKNSKSKELLKLIEQFAKNNISNIDNTGSNVDIANDIADDSDDEDSDEKHKCNDCKQKFAHRQGLYKHKKLNRCKAKQNNVTNNIQNTNNIVINNITNNVVNNDVVININVNSLGLENLDHISISDFKKIFRKMDTMMDNLCYHIFNRHIPNISFYKNNLNKKIVSYLTRNLEIERINENDFIIELRKYLEDICIQLFYNFKNQLSKDELILYMRNLVEYQNNSTIDETNNTSRKTKDAIIRVMDFAFRNKDIKEVIDSLIRRLQDNIEVKQQLVKRNKELNTHRSNVAKEFYYNGREIDQDNDNALYKLRKIAEEKNNQEDSKVNNKILKNSLANINFNKDTEQESN